MPPEILKEDKDYIVISKPTGLVVHSDGRTDEETLCDWVLKKYPEIEGIGESMELESGEVIERPGIVHRLDRDTSGAMVVARTQEGFEHLKKQFQDRLVEKKYIAIVYGNIKEDIFVVDEPIGRSRKNFRQWFSGRKVRGKTREAVTEFRVLKRSSHKEVTIVEVSPKTGRTHQIRVHLKSRYHPIICDKLYAPDRDCLLNMSRTALHSKTIKFQDLEGNEVSIEAPYPKDFEKAISLIE